MFSAAKREGADVSRGPEYARQQRITQALRMHGWLHTHFRPLRTEAGYRTPLSGDKGYPDITAVHPERGLLIFVEVKADRGRLSPEQRAWISALQQVDAEHGEAIDVWVCDSAEQEAGLLALISDGRIE